MTILKTDAEYEFTDKLTFWLSGCYKPLHPTEISLQSAPSGLWGDRTEVEAITSTSRLGDKIGDDHSTSDIEVYSHITTGFAQASTNAQSIAGELLQIRRWVLSSVCTDCPQHTRGYIRQRFSNVLPVNLVHHALIDQWSHQKYRPP